MTSAVAAGVFVARWWLTHRGAWLAAARPGVPAHVTDLITITVRAAPIPDPEGSRRGITATHSPDAEQMAKTIVIGELNDTIRVPFGPPVAAARGSIIR